MTPSRRPLLTLSDALPEKTLVDIRDNLSAIVLFKNHLWLGGDEGTQIERLTATADGNFGAHHRFDLRDFLDLPANAKSEVDIEGLDVDSGHLWLVGSHSLKRKKYDASKSDDENRKRFSEVVREANRYTFARIPLTGDGDLRAEGAGRLESDENGSQLTRVFRKDKQLAPFCDVPSKENGLDVEGLAVQGSRAFLGLRGPVLRGWAVLLEFEWREEPQGRLDLEQPLKKHLLDLDGLGVRELCLSGRDLLILAGPTMDLDGPVVVFRWPKALEQSGECIVTRKQLDRVLSVPYGSGEDAGKDHAEGITLAGDALLLCYDSPAPARLVSGAPNKVRADVFAVG